MALGAAAGLVALALPAGAVASSDAKSASSALGGAKASVSQLHLTRTVPIGSGSIRRYQQRVGGVPVLHGEVTVFTSSAGSKIGADATKRIAAKSALAPAGAAISASRAIAIARASTGASGLRTRPTARLVIDGAAGGTLVRRVVLASTRPLKDFEVLVDAHSGKVLATRNMLFRANGKAKLYVPNPVVENGGYSGLGTTAAADHNDQNTAKLTALRTAVALQDLKQHQKCLNGKYVEARLGKNTTNGDPRDLGKPVCKKGLDWRGVKRADNRFEVLMAYFHIDQTQRYLRSIGFTGQATVHPKQQKVIADWYKQDNSFFSGADKRLRIGTGGVDDGEDGDVIIHEYGHAVQNAQDPGFGSNLAAASLGEGFGDYQSATMSLHYGTGSNPTAGAYCIFDWDGVVGWGGPAAAPCGRVADGSDGINDLADANANCGNDPHCYGEVWAHGLIDLRLGLAADTSGRPPIDIDLYASQFAYADNESFGNAIDLLLQADQLNYGGSHQAAICNEMVNLRDIGGSSC